MKTQYDTSSSLDGFLDTEDDSRNGNRESRIGNHESGSGFG